ncbi:MAG: hypothetical protein HY363_04895 [Candidatus Aenigmarchaeota archaeon]|nr:hypothetical protein [Candidatus Aenigmarchaeota archaeon]
MLYWKNKDSDIPFFYVNVNATCGESKNKSSYKLTIKHPVVTESYDEIIRSGAGTIKRFCGFAEYERAQKKIEDYVVPEVRKLLNEIASKKGPVSIDNLAIPDFCI